MPDGIKFAVFLGLLIVSIGVYITPRLKTTSLEIMALSLVGVGGLVGIAGLSRHYLTAVYWANDICLLGAMLYGLFVLVRLYLFTPLCIVCDKMITPFIKLAVKISKILKKVVG